MSRDSGPPHNRDEVLTAIGRAAAPPVPTTDNGPSFGALTGVCRYVEPGSALVIGTPDTANRIRKQRSVIVGVPGMLAEIASNPSVETFIVEGQALRYGPWLGADDHQSRHLGEEIFEAGRLLRARGGQAWFFTTAELRGTMSARLLSTFTAHLGEIPEVDLEEGATQSTLWTTLVERVRNAQPEQTGQSAEDEQSLQDWNRSALTSMEAHE